MSTAIYKAEAKRLESAMQALQYNVSHSQSLELIASVHGARDWNTLAAQSKEVHAASVECATYLVMPDDRGDLDEATPYIIDANSPFEAKYKYRATVLSLDSRFRQYIEEGAINMSFAEEFWFEGADNLEAQPKPVPTCRFIENVQEWFDPEKELAEVFLSYHLHVVKGGDPTKVKPLPQAVYMFVAIKLDDDYSSLSVIDLGKVQRLPPLFFLNGEKLFYGQ